MGRDDAPPSTGDKPAEHEELTTGPYQPAHHKPVAQFLDFAAVAPLQRRRGRPTKDESARRADDLTRPITQHRYDLRSSRARK